jgi:hypothetical protein
MTTHTFTRKVTRRFGLDSHITYACNDCPFTITDTGDEAKKQWLRHELRAGAVIES